MKRVLTTYDLAMLGRLQDVLSEHQIPCFTKNDNPTGQAMGEVPPIVCVPELWIQDDTDLEKATTLINQFSEPIQASNWTCQDCNTPLPGSFTECWSCGVSRAS